MTTTQADDIAFALTRLLPQPGLDAQSITQIIGEAARFGAEVLAPHAQAADREGSRLENGRVRTPYAAQYRAWTLGGWQSLPAPEAHGGQGLPFALWCGVMEIFTAADMAFMLCPVLTAGAIEALERHATEDQKARWLPRMISAEWTGTMCLTEPQSGSDLSTIRTRAEPLGDGRYAIHGQKIYITYGDHDLTENNIHLVLARLPDAPPGTRGISLFAAPRVKPDGTMNAQRAASLERKMGIHASPTCVMLFEGAEAELIGEPHRGLPAMFAMMNNARVSVGVQGVGAGARALQLAESYAAMREQGGRPIARHADVARMLAEMRAITLAMRLLTLEAASGDAVRLALLTPIVKAWSTDRGVEVASLGVQVHGGMGFVEDAGAAQVLRDSRIAPIYEGTNGIQALDLVHRKLRADGGAAMLALLEEVRAAHPLLSGPAAALADAARFLLTAAPEECAAGATAFQEAAGWVLGGWMLARAAALDARYAPLARFYLRRLLPRASASLTQVKEADALVALMSA